MGINYNTWTQTSFVAKEGVKIINNSHYIVHTDPIFKKLHMVKLTEMFRIAIWKFYYKLRNNLLPPNLPVICNHYNVQNPKFHLPLIKQEYAKQLLQYCLIKLLNEEENASQIAYKEGEQPFCTFKSVIKYKLILLITIHALTRRTVSLAREVT